MFRGTVIGAAHEHTDKGSDGTFDWKGMAVFRNKHHHYWVLSYGAVERPFKKLETYGTVTIGQLEADLHNNVLLTHWPPHS